MEATSLERLLFALEKAEGAVIQELRRMYPVGMAVRVNVRHNQITPSEAIIVSHEGGRRGWVKVWLTKSPIRLVRRIAYENIESGGRA